MTKPTKCECTASCPEHLTTPRVIKVVHCDWHKNLERTAEYWQGRTEILQLEVERLKEDRDNEPQKESKPMTEKMSINQQIAIGEENAWVEMLNTIKQFGDLISTSEGCSALHVMFAAGYSAGFCGVLATNKDDNKEVAKVVKAAENMTSSASRTAAQKTMLVSTVALNRLKDCLNDYRATQPAKKESE